MSAAEVDRGGTDEEVVGAGKEVVHATVVQADSSSTGGEMLHVAARTASASGARPAPLARRSHEEPVDELLALPMDVEHMSVADMGDVVASSPPAVVLVGGVSAAQSSLVRATANQRAAKLRATDRNWLARMQDNLWVMMDYAAYGGINTSGSEGFLGAAEQTGGAAKGTTSEKKTISDGKIKAAGAKVGSPSSSKTTDRVEEYSSTHRGAVLPENSKHRTSSVVEFGGLNHQKSPVFVQRPRKSGGSDFDTAVILSAIAESFLQDPALSDAFVRNPTLHNLVWAARVNPASWAARVNPASVQELARTEYFGGGSETASVQELANQAKLLVDAKNEAWGRAAKQFGELKSWGEKAIDGKKLKDELKASFEKAHDGIKKAGEEAKLLSKKIADSSAAQKARKRVADSKNKVSELVNSIVQSARDVAQDPKVTIPLSKIKATLNEAKGSFDSLQRRFEAHRADPKVGKMGFFEDRFALFFQDGHLSVILDVFSFTYSTFNINKY